MHTSRCARTHVGTRMLGLHPSHESKLFETEKEIRNDARERGRKGDRETLKGIGRGSERERERESGGARTYVHTWLVTMSGRSCHGSYRVPLIPDMNLILL